MLSFRLANSVPRNVEVNKQCGVRRIISAFFLLNCLAEGDRNGVKTLMPIFYRIEFQATILRAIFMTTNATRLHNFRNFDGNGRPGVPDDISVGTDLARQSYAVRTN